MKLHQLQQALTALRLSRPSASVRSSKPSAPPSPDVQRSRREANGSSFFSERLARQIQAISSDDPYRRRRLLRCVLEACLVAEWGDTAADDPAFQALVDRVQTQMEEEPSLQGIVDDALSSLTTSEPSQREGHEQR